MKQTKGDFEQKFILDFLNFGSFRYQVFLDMLEKTYKGATSLEHKKMVFIELNSFFIKTIEDYAAYALTLTNAKAKNNKKCLIQTVETYESRDVVISHWLKGKTDKKIQLLFGLNNLYKKDKSIKAKDRKEICDKFVINLKLISEWQKDRRKFYNKTKHGNLILSSHKILNPDSSDSQESIGYISKDFTQHAMPYSDKEFKTILKNCSVIAKAIKEVVLLYTIKYHPLLFEEFNK